MPTSDDKGKGKDGEHAPVWGGSIMLALAIVSVAQYQNTTRGQWGGKTQASGNVSNQPRRGERDTEKKGG